MRLRCPPACGKGCHSEQNEVKSKNLRICFHKPCGFISRFFDYVRFAHFAQNDILFVVSTRIRMRG